MKWTLLHEHHGLRSFLLVLDKGEEAHAAITAFASEQDINAASLSAIGAASSATLGYFDPETSSYLDTEFNEQMELASCLGDIADDHGKPALHAHIVLGRRDYSAVAGHLQKLHVFPTMEIILTESPAHLRKRMDDATGLALIDPSRSHGG
ncbi:PPC domain-containing DNA-binding protein [Arthrobacter sp. E3]|uniref:PPC domain-containing DNA-binding protein n=1 Tax=Arthrobacter sp. E3 TaxID=517402 RepID=UPI001A94BB84|nr:PPC domain-containing DNA-binding protein [Arthrobacter sp. E3]